jgi:hypothetical protein
VGSRPRRDSSARTCHHILCGCKPSHWYQIMCRATAVLESEHTTCNLSLLLYCRKFILRRPYLPHHYCIRSHLLYMSPSFFDCAPGRGCEAFLRSCLSSDAIPKIRFWVRQIDLSPPMTAGVIRCRSHDNEHESTRCDRLLLRSGLAQSKCNELQPSSFILHM